VTEDALSPDEPFNATPKKWLTVGETAQRLNVSDCWVRRHKAELPLVRLGGLIRFNAALLERILNCRIPHEKPLKLRGAAMLIRFGGGNKEVCTKRVDEPKCGTACGAKSFRMPMEM
jgi:excisionase family DNA binding protein